MNWHGKRYYSFDSFLKNYFGEKIYKVSLDGGFTCPNRDGTLGVELLPAVMRMMYLNIKEGCDSWNLENMKL